MCRQCFNCGAGLLGFHTGKDVERDHTQFCKSILRVFRSMSNFMICTELGGLPLIVFRKLKILKYPMKILDTQNCI